MFNYFTTDILQSMASLEKLLNHSPLNSKPVFIVRRVITKLALSKSWGSSEYFDFLPQVKLTGGRSGGPTVGEANI